VWLPVFLTSPGEPGSLQSKRKAKQSKAEAKQSKANAKCKVQKKCHIPPFTELTTLQGKHDNIYKILHIFTINFFYNIFQVTQPN
jgi:hypothetical protein